VISDDLRLSCAAIEMHADISSAETVPDNKFQIKQWVEINIEIFSR
jgi:hypothetical protein